MDKTELPSEEIKQEFIVKQDLLFTRIKELIDVLLPKDRVVMETDHWASCLYGGLDGKEINGVWYSNPQITESGTYWVSVPRLSFEFSIREEEFQFKEYMGLLMHRGIKSGEMTYSFAGLASWDDEQAINTLAQFSPFDEYDNDSRWFQSIDTCIANLAGYLLRLHSEISFMEIGIIPDGYNYQDSPKIQEYIKDDLLRQKEDKEFDESVGEDTESEPVTLSAHTP